MAIIARNCLLYFGIASCIITGMPLVMELQHQFADRLKLFGGAAMLLFGVLLIALTPLVPNCPKNVAYRWYGFAMCMMTFGGGGAVLGYISVAREISKTDAMRSNMDAILLGIKNYHAAYAATPGVDITDVVRQRLIDAAKGEDSKAIIASLYQDHSETVKEHWETLRVVPESLRRDEAQSLGYTLTVLALASYFQEQGDSSLLDILAESADQPSR